jgi:hypothetical protein
MKYVIFILFIAICCSCSKNSDPFSENSKDSFYGIYFLQDTAITEQKIAEMDINTLVLDKNPWLTQKDIEFYDFSTHCIYLKKDKNYFFENYKEKLFQFNPLLMSRPFVVIADHERCYVGALHSGALSTAPIWPYIDELDVGYFPEDVIHISRAWSDKDDMRSNPHVAEILKKQNLFHAGLEIELISFQILNNSDTSTVEYSIQITNNDQDNLYVIDPEKTGSKLFHYYTNGPDLWDYSKPLYLYSEYKNVTSPEPFDSWNFEWFTLLKSKQSMQRSIRLTGYPHIPNGNYVGYINFENPINIVKEDRHKPDGRIWIGDIRSNDLQINVQ